MLPFASNAAPVQPAPKYTERNFKARGKTYAVLQERFASLALALLSGQVAAEWPPGNARVVS